MKNYESKLKNYNYYILFLIGLKLVWVLDPKRINYLKDIIKQGRGQTCKKKLCQKTEKSC